MKAGGQADDVGEFANRNPPDVGAGEAGGETNRTTPSDGGGGGGE